MGVAPPATLRQGRTERGRPPHQSQLTHLAVPSRVSGADYRAWRTRPQNATDSGSVQIGMQGGRESGSQLPSPSAGPRCGSIAPA
jgi:hypothetical protein